MSYKDFGVSLLICKNGYKNSFFSFLTIAVDFLWEEEYLCSIIFI